MPGDLSSAREKAAGAKKRVTDKGSVSRGRRSTDSEMQDYFVTQSSVLPPQFKARLNEWFAFIEGEFEALYAQNIELQEKVERLSERLQQKEDESSRHSSLVTFTEPALAQTATSGQFGGQAGSITAVDSPLLTSSSSAGLSAGLTAKQRSQLPPQPQQLKMPKVGGSSKSKAAVKLRVQTSRIVSSFKTSPVQCRMTRQYLGHRDGVWDVDTVYRDALLLATASADQTACIWGAECGRVVLQYTGHSGSVNCIKFHPSREVVLSASGDHTAHVWQAAISHDHLRVQSSEDEVEGSGEEEEDGGGGGVGGEGGGGRGRHSTLRTPLLELRAHSGVVSAADWMAGGDQILTAAWDRLACIHDANTGQLLSQLTGHDRELTHCCCHPTQRLVATASQDTTFRLYDSRDLRHTVSVFQGHTESVTSVCFTQEDKVVSGSDDRSVKVWDIKNMRSPLAMMRLDSPVNRLAVSSSGSMIAIPHDNRQVRLYDLNGIRLARLPHSNRQGHRRMVCAVAWADDAQFLSHHTSSAGGCGTATGSSSNVITSSASVGTGPSPGSGGRDSLPYTGIAGNQPSLLFTAGFDRRVYGWEVSTVKEKE